MAAMEVVAMEKNLAIRANLDTIPQHYAEAAANVTETVKNLDPTTWIAKHSLITILEKSGGFKLDDEAKAGLRVLVDSTIGDYLRTVNTVGTLFGALRSMGTLHWASTGVLLTATLGSWF